MTNEHSKAMRYAFFSERGAAKTEKNDILSGVLIELSTVAIIGAGIMGSAIAMACASKGYRVTLIKTDIKALERGLKKSLIHIMIL